MFTTKNLSESDPTLFTCSAQVLDVIREDGVSIVILDQTVFRPDSKEQMTETGRIESDEKTFHVKSVEESEGCIRHIGLFESESFEIDEMVTCVMNEEYKKEMGLASE